MGASTAVSELVLPSRAVSLQDPDHSAPNGTSEESEARVAAERTWRQVVVINCGGTINMTAGEGSAPGTGVKDLLKELGEDFDTERLWPVEPFARPVPAAVPAVRPAAAPSER